MEQHGFIQDMLDVKVLILFVMAKLSYPVSLQKIYELCYQDDKLSYFDVSVAVPQMVQSGHLQQLPDDTYVITDKGREHEEITCDAIAYPVMQRALMAVQRYNTRMQRKGLIETQIEQEVKVFMDGCGEANSEHYRVVWQEIASERLDIKRLKQEKPEIYREYVQSRKSSRFTVKVA